VADAEFVEDVGVVDREVGDDEVGGEEQLEHIHADVALPENLPGRPPRDAEFLQRRADQLRLDGVEVYLVLHPERADDKCSHVATSEYV
jgi:hypothetical protein